MGKDWISLSWEPKLPSPSLRKSRDSGSNPKEPDIGGLWSPPKEQLIDGFFLLPSDPRKLNPLLRKQAIDTAGSNWFDMPAPAVTAELKKDLQLLKVSTVIESSAEFYSSRLTKREWKATLADELVRDSRKRKVREIEEKNMPVGNDKWKKVKGQTTNKASSAMATLIPGHNLL